MTSIPSTTTAVREQLIEAAARLVADHPKLSALALIAEYKLSVSEAHAALARAGTKAVIVCPIGFVADHIEVVWDLDNELSTQAEAVGVALVRASTPNAHPRFAQMAADLIDELRCGRTPERVAGPDPVPGCLASANGAPCRPPHCAAGTSPSIGRR